VGAGKRANNIDIKVMANVSVPVTTLNALNWTSTFDTFVDYIQYLIERRL